MLEQNGANDNSSVEESGKILQQDLSSAVWGLIASENRLEAGASQPAAQKPAENKLPLYLDFGMLPDLGLKQDRAVPRSKTADKAHVAFDGYIRS